MKTITAYLSGPMYMGKEQASKWRDEIDFHIIKWNHDFGHPTGVRIVTLNPCNRWLEKGGELEAEGSYVVQMDKMEIAKSNVLIVNATDPGWGTPIEQYIGWSTGKMVIGFANCDFPSIWARAHSHKMFRTHIKAVEWLCDVASHQLARVV